MRMMERLLRNVGRSWDKIPKELPVLLVRKGTGLYERITIRDNVLYLHTSLFEVSLPAKEQINLADDMSLTALVEALEAYGYVVEITREATKQKVNKRASFTLLPVENLHIIEGGMLITFTSKLWEFLYPIARVLQEVENDIDLAMQQLYATMASGRWLEYWASFFGVKRLRNEDDEALRRRIFVTLANIKTNNVAIEEVLRYRLKDIDVTVTDRSPADFEVALNHKYAGDVSELYELIDSVKGAGIKYLVAFMNTAVKDNINVDYNSYNFEVPYRITNILTTATYPGKLLGSNIGIEQATYHWAVEYPICNLFTTFQVESRPAISSLLLVDFPLEMW